MGTQTSYQGKHLVPYQTGHWLGIRGLLAPFSNAWKSRDILPRRLKKMRRLGTWQGVKQQVRLQRTQD